MGIKSFRKNREVGRRIDFDYLKKSIYGKYQNVPLGTKYGQKATPHLAFVL
jgi:hypothetical protein